MRMEEIIVRPLITEKATELRDERNIVAFEVSMAANKIEIQRAVEAGELCESDVDALVNEGRVTDAFDDWAADSGYDVDELIESVED